MPIIAIAYRRAFTSVPSEVRRLSGASCAYIQRRTRVLNQLSRQVQAACRICWPLTPAATFRCSCRSKRKTISIAFCSAQPDAAIGGHASEQGAQPAGSGRHVKHGSRQQTRWLRLLHAVNDSTKWLVMAAASAALVFHPTAEVLCCIIGSVAAALTCKVLKVALNQSRPPGARLADPGMPSSHANSLGYFGSYVAFSLMRPPVIWTSILCAAATALVTVTLAWLRVLLGYHTPQQMSAGLALGCLIAAVSRRSFDSYVASVSAADPAYGPLCAVTALAVCTYGLAFIRKWLPTLRAVQSAR